jgi:hypothetical protein
MHMAYMGAAVCGIGTGGVVDVKKRSPAHVVIGRPSMRR